MPDSRTVAVTSETDRDRGASLVEYALLVALIAVVCAVATSFLGAKTSGGLSSSGSSIFGA